MQIFDSAVVRLWAKVVLGVFVVAAVGVFGWQLLPNREPSYQGKTLTTWFGDGPNPNNELYEALRLAGTNAYPVLLRMLRKEDLPGVLELVALAQKQWFFPVHYVPATIRHSQAVYGIGALGEHSKDLLPGLIEIYDSKGSGSSQSAVAKIFAGIGPDAETALPSLLRGLNTTNEVVLANTIYAILRVNMACPKADQVVPALTKFLHNASPVVRAKAAAAIGFFGPEAKAAVCHLLPLVYDPDTEVMAYAIQALKRIDPEVAAELGVD